MEVDAGSGKERVGGRLRPGNEVRRTLSVSGAIVDIINRMNERGVVIEYTILS